MSLPGPPVRAGIFDNPGWFLSPLVFMHSGLIIMHVYMRHFPSVCLKDAHTVYTNTRPCPPASQKLYFRVPLPAKWPKIACKVAKNGLQNGHKYTNLAFCLSLFYTCQWVLKIMTNKSSELVIKTLAKGVDAMWHIECLFELCWGRTSVKHQLGAWLWERGVQLTKFVSP